jgi:hypothetical protein
MFGDGSVQLGILANDVTVAPSVRRFDIRFLQTGLLLNGLPVVQSHIVPTGSGGACAPVGT